MLRRSRQIKMQIQQLLDAVIFGVSFLLAWTLRGNSDIIRILDLHPIGSFQDFFWFYLALIVAGPLVLESQGFYDRSLLSSRRSTIWPLFKGCLLTAVGLIIALFFWRESLARSVAILFCIISFLLIFIKEELIRAGMKSQFARSQFQRRFILVGTPAETSQMRRELAARAEDDLAVLAEFNLKDQSVEDLTQLLHQHSINGVILNARHNYFEKVERAIS